MTIRVVNEANQALVVSWFTQNILNKDELAAKFNVSERTIGRILDKHGIEHLKFRRRAAGVKAQDKRILEIVSEHDVTPEQLEEIFNAPALTIDNVFHFLCDLSEDEISLLQYRVGLVKIYEKAQANQDDEDGVETVDFKQMEIEDA